MKQREENASEEDSQAERAGISFLLFFVGGRVMGGLGGGRGVKAVLIETWPNQTH